MPLRLLFLTAGMLSLRSGLLLFHQGKSKSPSVANRGKPEQEAKPTIVILNAVKNLASKDPSCLRMTENC
jgi:hypothetical protein